MSIIIHLKFSYCLVSGCACLYQSQMKIGNPIFGDSRDQKYLLSSIDKLRLIMKFEEPRNLSKQLFEEPCNLSNFN